VQIAILFLAVLSIGLSGYAIWRDEPPDWNFAATPPARDGAPPAFDTVFDYSAPSGQAHAPAIVPQGEGLDLLWFEGSREGADDVEIRCATFRRGDCAWRQVSEGTLMTARDMSEIFQPRQLVSTLGNTIENEVEQDRLFVTVVSVGGWAMAAVADVVLRGGVPVSAHKLNLSPFLNRSHLVKSPMVKFADGSHGLPAYFEMGATYGTLVRFAKDGRVRDMVRMSGEGKPIEPMIVPLNETRAVAFLRDFDPTGHVLKCETPDGGQTWTDAVPINMANPSAPVAALSLGHGLILMVANDETAPNDRLSLLLSQDEGETFQFIKELASPGAGARYPMLRALADGTILLTYSVGNKKGLRVLAFNSDWVAVQ